MDYTYNMHLRNMLFKMINEPELKDTLEWNGFLL